MEPSFQENREFIWKKWSIFRIFDGNAWICAGSFLHAGRLKYTSTQFWSSYHSIKIPCGLYSTLHFFKVLTLEIGIMLLSYEFNENFKSESYLLLWSGLCHFDKSSRWVILVKKSYFCNPLSEELQTQFHFKYIVVIWPTLLKGWKVVHSMSGGLVLKQTLYNITWHCYSWGLKFNVQSGI